ncbi:methylthioribulose 1-phosphate dehydratase [Pseudomarimonas arenosa]|uniref:Methylthioribulose-1-phosphate dehydratase n=1 Tax=Pseudomarimonas arenosa TaxID=2774145 RepID=A0AAW3ZUE6_9GAMM|nr:methylthioribulose 1-phosphate dehydratase [Pseudomarimonas arenosa]MBD8528074.1 methylthioribulose 1-phosphate dehydratase [Pseudomarimonas arenosa]
MITLPFSANAFHEVAQQLIAITAEVARRGWTPATSSNFSMRLDHQHAVITVSGRDKGQLTEKDFMVVDMNGQPVASEHRPSAETKLHNQLYQHDERIGCVLHTHSHNQTVMSRLCAKRGHIALEGYELLKAFPGHHTHDASVKLAVLGNRQDMDLLSCEVAPHLKKNGLPAYLIEGHGLYAWGQSAADAMRHLEACEFLLGVELEMLRLQAAPSPRS